MVYLKLSFLVFPIVLVDTIFYCLKTMSYVNDIMPMLSALVKAFACILSWLFV